MYWKSQAVKVRLSQLSRSPLHFAHVPTLPSFQGISCKIASAQKAAEWAKVSCPLFEAPLAPPDCAQPWPERSTQFNSLCSPPLRQQCPCAGLCTVTPGCWPSAQTKANEVRILHAMLSEVWFGRHGPLKWQGAKYSKPGKRASA